MLAAQQKSNNIVLVDFPRTMVDTNDKVKTFIQNGEAGKIQQVQTNIHNYEGDLIERPIPISIDFEAFCGPAPKQKFICSQDADNPIWRFQHDFSRGVMADWAFTIFTIPEKS